MPEPRHLNNAPITEALFDIRVKARSDFKVTDFSDLKVRLQDRFPEVEERHEGKVRLQIQKKSGPSTSLENFGLNGYFFKSKAENLIAQFRVDGFTLNKLKPYSDWEELFPIVLELWDLYCSIAEPEAVTRQAVRCINRIPNKSDFIDFDEYLRAAPQIPQELPQLLGAFLSRVTIMDNEYSVAAHVVQAFEFTPGQSGITIILDIDAFKEVDILPGDKPLIENFSQLRKWKNLIFFNYLTEKTLGLLE